jgi:alkanesulfonate monooxygenase SsuD/methylene tetrahydromethanopterin reductase-like flavin-dependent oxidoreductase (luciferase family)
MTPRRATTNSWDNEPVRDVGVEAVERAPAWRLGLEEPAERPSLGVVLPTFPGHPEHLPDAADLATFARGAEAAGADALWACDHLFWHGPSLEAFVALGAAAAATRRAVLGTAVLQLPLRRPEVVAKQAASLWWASRGRFVLGVGAGSHAGEYAQAEVRFDKRGRMLDEAIARLRSLWRTDADSGYPMLPKPERLPVWVGGSSPAARRRAGLAGDGWVPVFVPPEEYRVGLEEVRAAAASAGRDPSGLAAAAVGFVSVAAPGEREEAARERGLDWLARLYRLPARAFERHLVAGDPLRCAARLMEWVRAGARHVVAFVTHDRPLVAFEALAEAYQRARTAGGARDAGRRRGAEAVLQAAGRPGPAHREHKEGAWPVA